MRRRTAIFVFLLSALGPTGTTAMDVSSQPTGHCQIIGGHMLPPSVGESNVCAEVEQAIASAAPNISYEAKVTVLSSSRLTAALVVNGRTLPEQKFAIMDRELNRGAVRRFAQTLAIEVARAAKP